MQKKIKTLAKNRVFNKIEKNNFFIKIFIPIFIFSIIIIGVNRLTYNMTTSLKKGLYWKKIFSDYKKNDIALFKMDMKYSKYIEDFPNKDKMKNIYLMKRIVAVEGDVIETKNDGTLLINGERRGKIFKIRGLTEKIEDSRYTLKKGEYYLLGDTEISFDSRYFGILKRKDFKYEMRLLMEEEKLLKIIEFFEKFSKK